MRASHVIHEPGFLGLWAKKLFGVACCGSITGP